MNSMHAIIIMKFNFVILIITQFNFIVNRKIKKFNFKKED